MGKGYIYLVQYEDSPELVEIEYMLVTEKGITRTNWIVPGTSED